ncbi:MAG TPA: hypothetical protein VMX38_15585 [Verrucomicrobiae bacterium]|jgi:cytoskeletal protein CcmA (bactofilin family)|nr:hypothetical protein [Verrucomicrobiae bacterium]
MTTEMAPFFLMMVTLGLLAVPIAPALFELKKRKDASPLPTSRHDGHIENFAEVFRGRVDQVRYALQQCRDEGKIEKVQMEGADVLVVGCKDFELDQKLMYGVSALIFAQSAQIPADCAVEVDIYAEEMLNVGDGSMLRAALSAGNVSLGENSKVLRWLHADGDIHLQKGSVALGRLSAGQSIRLRPGVIFQHIHAPSISTGHSRHSPHLPMHCGCESAEDPGPSSAFRSRTFASRPRIRVKGEFVLPAGETLNANVIAAGDVRLERGTRFFGNLKSYGDVRIGEETCTHGSIVCEGTIRIGSRCFAAGPIMAEREIQIGADSCVGRSDAHTTISSRTVKISTGCEIHGSVWARLQGSVED